MSAWRARSSSSGRLPGHGVEGGTPAEDLEIAAELMQDPKERAEHIMLVDLGRNDVGRVAKIGSVKVTELLQVEKYSHVMHLVSHVVGELAEGKDCYDVMRATFPQGTVSGAPKIRAMEIIEELEPTKRGPYAGAVGYFSYSGNMDTCIALRTMTVKGNTAYRASRRWRGGGFGPRAGIRRDAEQSQGLDAGHRTGAGRASNNSATVAKVRRSTDAIDRRTEGRDGHDRGRDRQVELSSRT